MLVELSLKLHTATWLTLRAAWPADQRSLFCDSAALAKKTSTHLAFEAADTAIQIHGGYGVSRECPFEFFCFDARFMRLVHGREDEINKKIAERFAGGPPGV
jgi:butyryl-CoA dehydrogenase